jgi:hypothetical protein
MPGDTLVASFEAFEEDCFYFKAGGKGIEER